MVVNIVVKLFCIWVGDKLGCLIWWKWA